MRAQRRCILDHEHFGTRHPSPGHLLPNVDAVSHLDAVPSANKRASGYRDGGYRDGDGVPDTCFDGCPSGGPVINAVAASHSHT
jgi:hypothetical protein